MEGFGTAVTVVLVVVIAIFLVFVIVSFFQAPTLIETTDGSLVVSISGGWAPTCVEEGHYKLEKIELYKEVSVK